MLSYRSENIAFSLYIKDSFPSRIIANLVHAISNALFTIIILHYTSYVSVIKSSWRKTKAVIWPNKYDRKSEIKYLTDWIN
jgi:hypothetical protein